MDLTDLSALPDPLPIHPVGGPLDAEVTVPGSKSITNRALVCAALADGTSTLLGALAADDVSAMVGVLAGVGVTVEVEAGVGADGRDGGTTISVRGCAGRPSPATDRLDVRQSGTTARFVPPLLALGSGPYELTAHPQMQARPMNATFDALRALGVTVTEQGAPGALPAAIVPGDRRGGTVEVAGDVSSQFLSGLLLAAPCFEGGLTLALTTDLVSRPYVDLTIAVMASFGAEVARPDDRTFVVAPTGYQATSYAIEPDASAASYPLAAAAVCGGRVLVRGLGPDALQGDAGFADLLGAMGAEVVRDERGTEVRANRGELRGGTFDLTHLSDTAPTLACVAPFATDPVTIGGIGFIRRKEIDRVAAVASELRRCGIDAHEDDDGWTIRPGTPAPAVVETYDDHRMAMSFALLGLAVDGIGIAGPTCVAKTFPRYWAVLDDLTGGSIRSTRPLGSTPVYDLPDVPADDAAGPADATGAADGPALTVIAIDGPAGSGKSTVGRALAARLGLHYLDTGAMYRGVTFAAIRRGIDPADHEVVARLAQQVELEVEDGRVTVDGVDATIEIRGPEVTRAVSLVAANPAVREELVRRQREWAEERGGGVLEGRDIGSVVFPDALLKVYLDASPEVRASRRSKEVTDLSYETVAADLARRDALDQGRESSPLTVADGAVHLDTSHLGIEEIVASLVELVEEARR